MITKIFFTMLVIIVVGMIFKTQGQSKNAEQEQQNKPGKRPDETTCLAPKSVAYMLVGLLIIVSGVVYYFSWSDAN